MMKGAGLGGHAPPFKLVNDVNHLYIPVYVYCTDDTVRVRRGSHKNDVTYFYQLTSSLTMYHQ